MFDVASVGTASQIAPKAQRAVETRSRPSANTNDTSTSASASASAPPQTAPAKTSDAGTAAAAEDAARAETGVVPNTRLSIFFDDASRLFITRSVERESGEVVTQFPTEEVIRRVTAAVEALQEADPPSVSFSA